MSNKEFLNDYLSKCENMNIENESSKISEKEKEKESSKNSAKKITSSNNQKNINLLPKK